MLNFSSIAEGKAFILAVKLFETKKTRFDTVSQAFNAVLNATIINNRNILEGLSLLDRNRFFEFILSNSQGFIDILSEEAVRKIRISALTCVYQKHELSEIKNEIMKELGGRLFGIIQNIQIDFYEVLSEDAAKIVKNVLIEDLAFFLADRIKNSKLDIDGKISIDVLNLASEKDLNKIVFEKASELISQKFSNQISLKISNIYDQMLDISNQIFINLASFVQSEIRTYATKTNIQNIRERERFIGIREQEVEGKEIKIQEIMTKNLEFSRELQKKSAEIDSRLDQIEAQRLALQDYMDKIVDICKKVIDFSVKLK